jgi:hypothetical protein
MARLKSHSKDSTLSSFGGRGRLSSHAAFTKQRRHILVCCWHKFVHADFLCGFVVPSSRSKKSTATSKVRPKRILPSEADPNTTAVVDKERRDEYPRYKLRWHLVSQFIILLLPVATWVVTAFWIPDWNPAERVDRVLIRKYPA